MEGENGEAASTQEVATLNLSACPHTPSAFPTPATSDCNGGSAGGGAARTQSNHNKKRSRSAPWTVSEMLTLIDAKKEERERCQIYKLQGVKLPAAEKWRIVATHMESKDMGRSGSQCQDKWENMMKDYKAVREWQYIMNPTGKNYFKEMTNKERKDASLPPQMDEIVFYSLHAIQNEKEEKKDKARRKIERDSFKQPNVGNSVPVGTLATKDKVSKFCERAVIPTLISMFNLLVKLALSWNLSSKWPSRKTVALLVSEVLRNQYSSKRSLGSTPYSSHISMFGEMQSSIRSHVNQFPDSSTMKVGSSEANDMESMDTDSSGKRRRRKKVELDKPPISLENPVVLDDFVHAMKDGSKELVECFMKVLERNERQTSGETDTKTKDTATLAQVLVALADAVKTIAEKL